MDKLFSQSGSQYGAALIKGDILNALGNNYRIFKDVGNMDAAFDKLTVEQFVSKVHKFWKTSVQQHDTSASTAKATRTNDVAGARNGRNSGRPGKYASKAEKYKARRERRKDRKASAAKDNGAGGATGGQQPQSEKPSPTTPRAANNTNNTQTDQLPRCRVCKDGSRHHWYDCPWLKFAQDVAAGPKNPPPPPKAPVAVTGDKKGKHKKQEGHSAVAFADNCDSDSDYEVDDDGESVLGEPSAPSTSYGRGTRFARK